jgi:hypothetical protein
MTSGLTPLQQALEAFPTVELGDTTYICMPEIGCPERCWGCAAHEAGSTEDAFDLCSLVGWENCDGDNQPPHIFIVASEEAVLGYIQLKMGL